MSALKQLKLKNKSLAYIQHEGRAPGVVYIHGFRSDMDGEKAIAVERHCLARGQAFMRFDCSGHGKSSGEFVEGNISQWKQDVVDVLKKLTDSPQVLVGSSMGGWLALLATLEAPKKVCGIVGIAAAPDFTERLMWDVMTETQQQEIMEKGVIYAPSHYSDEVYPITRQFIEDGRKNLLLHKRIDIDCPVHLLHGIKDAEVPWEISLSINEKLTSKDVKCTLIEQGDHRLSNPENLVSITKILERMLKRFD